MSFQFCGKLWVATKQDLKNVILREKILLKLQPTRDRNYAHRFVGNIFARYIVLCNNLSELYDQTLQAQKRSVIEKILVSATKRLLELQKEMQKIEMSQFVYLDDALVELKLTPQNVEFLRPFYFPRRRAIEMQRIVDEIPKVEPHSKPELKGLDKYRKVLTPEEIAEKQKQEMIKEAVDLIKVHEKARQARVFSLNMREFPEKFKPPSHEPEPFPYDFIHLPNQAPMHKIKRTNYETDFYKPKVNIAKFTFYEPPQYRINRLGQKVLVVRKKSEIFEERLVIETDSDEIATTLKIEHEMKLKAAEDAQKEKQRVNAASVIQRAFRRYQLRKALLRRKWQRMELCGLVSKPDDRDKLKLKDVETKMCIKRRERKKEFDERFVKAIEDEKARILKFRTDSIMEDISDDIRQWFREFYSEAKDFHRYPEEFEGGTIMVVRGETRTPKEFLIEKNKTPAQKLKEKSAKKKSRKDAKALKKKLAEQEKKNEIARKKLEQKQGPTWNFADKKFESENFVELEKSFADYEHDWQFLDEMENHTEQPIWDWVTLDAYADVHKELRLIVDDFMRIELEILRVALAVDQKTRYVPPKHKKPKKEKKKRKPSEVDVTEGRDLAECYDELKALNIIRKYPQRSLDDFIGDESFTAAELRAMNKNPIVKYGDIKNNLRTMLVGMGPLELPKVKSLCIAGPPKCGKKVLVDAICTELDAVMFDLSSKVIAPIPNLLEVLPLVMQMAKNLQPSVIFIDGAHKPFMRKVAEDEIQEKPRKLGPFLFKRIVKKLSNDDAILLLGTTNQPWNCGFGKLRMCYERIVMFPPTLDYGTALMTWNKGMQMKRIHDFNASSLAQVTRKYTTGDILELIDGHVDLRRRMKLAVKPLTSEELLEGIIDGPNAKKPLDEKTIKSYHQFALMIDPFFVERRDTMARVQIDVDKEKADQAKRLEMQKKKKLQGK